MGGFELKALWDDGTFGPQRCHQFSRIAVVTEQIWLRVAVTMLSSLFPSELPLIRLSELQGAKTWIVVTDKAVP
ncbi:MAG: STAS/SEC14 domain-containing protein [Rhodanobacteraceae bacterium]